MCSATASTVVTAWSGVVVSLVDSERWTTLRIDWSASSTETAPSAAMNRDAATRVRDHLERWLESNDQLGHRPGDPVRETTYVAGTKLFVDLPFDGGRLVLWEAVIVMDSCWLSIDTAPRAVSGHGGLAEEPDRSYEMILTPPLARTLLEGLNDWLGSRG